MHVVFAENRFPYILDFHRFLYIARFALSDIGKFNVGARKFFFNFFVHLFRLEHSEATFPLSNSAYHGRNYLLIMINNDNKNARSKKNDH